MILAFYVLRQFITTFVFTLIALSLLFVIIDLFENMDKFIDRSVPFPIVVEYYLAYLPFILKLLIPVATLLSALFGVGRLATFNELTAMRAGGQSFLRFLAPFMAISLLISVGQVYFNGWVVPAATTAKFEIERDVLHESVGASLFNLAFRESPSRNVIIEYYDHEAHTARNVTIEEFGDPMHPRLEWRMDAMEMHWDTTQLHWRSDSLMLRTFGEKGVTIEWLYNEILPFSIRHTQIVNLQRDPDELTFPETKEYIATLHAGGKDTRDQEIAYYAGWAFPFANLIVVLIAVPFASVRRRGGLAVNVAAAMVLAFVYIAFTEVSQAVGATMDVSAVIVGWSANAIFLCMAFASIFLVRR